ncbi:phosphatidylserine/phosphatidylglycerophosphate/cardiolipin synthase-like enzyme [Catalinimonas alkaloidigena]|uniref:phospholipase D-like domain-containing protein n=1 Tax=Catalinimonas alkaloidigena TaxID=1075417 RepID=UPI0024062BC7|nr:phospholipase D-like domain-containing protein [Catalinimonas alkaloidigena]MDF9801066.1 phosphatidylserine/phosphatidylglycerophosphate/cardiolipin synthase-like enzyme [Catalinimonas alkaloidigena]
MQAAIKDATIHMGPSVGKQLLEDIRSARQEVTVLSPFLNEEQMHLLLQLHAQNVRITLITTLCHNMIGNLQGYDFREKLIKQYRRKNHDAEQKKESLKGIITFLYFALTAFVLGCIYTYFYYYTYAQICMLFLTVLTLIVLFATAAELRNTSVYYYSYRTIFPLKIFIDPGNQRIKNSSKHFIHAKAFIIDQKIAYLGSADFTCLSLSSNYESIIRIEDRGAIQELHSEIMRLYKSTSKDMDFVDTEAWGKMIYDEPLK